MEEQQQQVNQNGSTASIRILRKLKDQLASYKRQLQQNKSQTFLLDKLNEYNFSKQLKDNGIKYRDRIADFIKLNCEDLRNIQSKFSKLREKQPPGIKYLVLIDEGYKNKMSQALNDFGEFEDLMVDFWNFKLGGFFNSLLQQKGMSLNSLYKFSVSGQSFKKQIFQTLFLNKYTNLFNQLVDYFKEVYQSYLRGLKTGKSFIGVRFGSHYGNHEKLFTPNQLFKFDHAKQYKPVFKKITCFAINIYSMQIITCNNLSRKERQASEKDEQIAGISFAASKMLDNSSYSGHNKVSMADETSKFNFFDSLSAKGALAISSIIQDSKNVVIALIGYFAMYSNSYIYPSHIRLKTIYHTQKDIPKQLFQLRKQFFKFLVHRTKYRLQYAGRQLLQGLVLLGLYQEISYLLPKGQDISLSFIYMNEHKITQHCVNSASSYLTSNVNDIKYQTAQQYKSLVLIAQYQFMDQFQPESWYHKDNQQLNNRNEAHQNLIEQYNQNIKQFELENSLIEKLFAPSIDYQQTFRFFDQLLKNKRSIYQNVQLLLMFFSFQNYSQLQNLRYRQTGQLNANMLKLRKMINQPLESSENFLLFQALLKICKVSLLTNNNTTSIFEYMVFVHTNSIMINQQYIKSQNDFCYYADQARTCYLMRLIDVTDLISYKLKVNIRVQGGQFRMLKCCSYDFKQRQKFYTPQFTIFFNQLLLDIQKNKQKLLQFYGNNSFEVHQSSQFVYHQLKYYYDLIVMIQKGEPSRELASFIRKHIRTLLSQFEEWKIYASKFEIKKE